MELRSLNEDKDIWISIENKSPSEDGEYFVLRKILAPKPYKMMDVVWFSKDKGWYKNDVTDWTPYLEPGIVRD